jgi:osmotically-inducible protein OsmY
VSTIRSFELSPFSPALFSQMSEFARSRLRPQDGLIRKNVNRVLLETGYAPLRCIQCDVSDGVVELTGSVPSFYIKQLAQTAVLRLKQIRGIKNRLRVA